MLNLSDAVWLAFLTSSVAALAFYLVYAAGQLNVSQPGFMAIGAYSVALSTTREGLSLVPSLIIAFAVITVLALLLDLVTERLGGVYLAMATLAFVIVVQQLIVINPSVSGAIGIHGIPRMLTIPRALAILVVVSLVIRRLMRSRMGYEMRTAREDVVAARAMGIDLRALRRRTAIASAWVAGLAGVMEAMHSSFVGPSDFGFGRLIVILGIAIVGGTDRWWGPISGAIFLTVLPEFTRGIARYRDVIAGLLILGVIVVFPEGVVGGVMRLKRWLVTRRSPGDPGSTGGTDVHRSEIAPTEEPQGEASR